MIIVQTQHRENYGAHDWDGIGECPQYWKNKGGETYVLDSGVNPVDFYNAVNFKTDYAEELVLNVYKSDELPAHEPWESLIFVTTGRDGWFLCNRTTMSNDTYRSEIESKYSSWLMGPKHATKEHTVVYTMTNGDHVNSENLADWYDRQERIEQPVY